MWRTVVFHLLKGLNCSEGAPLCKPFKCHQLHSYHWCIVAWAWVNFKVRLRLTIQPKIKVFSSLIKIITLTRNVFYIIFLKPFFRKVILYVCQFVTSHLTGRPPITSSLKNSGALVNFKSCNMQKFDLKFVKGAQPHLANKVGCKHPLAKFSLCILGVDWYEIIFI